MTGNRRATQVQPWIYLLMVGIVLVFGFLTNRAGNIQGCPRQTAFPIIAFELAGGAERAEQILSETVDSLAVADTGSADVRSTVEAAVRTSLWWDLGFILGYSLLIFMVAPVLGRQIGGRTWIRLGRVIGWGGLLAGGLDVIENTALFQVLKNTARGGWAIGAALASWGKWALVAISVAFGLAGLARLAVRTVARLTAATEW